MTMPCSLAAAMVSLSRTEPPGWMTASTPASAMKSRPSRKGKKASEAATQPLVLLRAFISAMRLASTRLIWPEPMPTVCVPRTRDDGVGLDVLDDLPGEQHGLPLRRGGLALRDDAQVFGGQDGLISVLYQRAAGDAAPLAPGFLIPRGTGFVAPCEQDAVALAGQQGQRFGMKRRGQQDLQEAVADGLGHGGVYFPVATDDATRGGVRVGVVGALVRLGGGGGDSNAARRLVLQNDHRQLVEFLHGRQGGIGVARLLNDSSLPCSCCASIRFGRTAAVDAYNAAPWCGFSP